MATTKRKFSLTYSITTEESARNGDHAAHGFVTANDTFPRKYNGYIPKNPYKRTLRACVEFLQEHRGPSDPVYTDGGESIAYPPRWISVNDRDNSCPGDEDTEVSMHLDGVTPSTALRILALVKGEEVKALQGVEDDLETTPVIHVNDISRQDYIGAAEIDGSETHVVRITTPQGQYFVAGGACNAGLLPSFAMAFDPEYDGVDETLQEFIADLEAGDHPSGELLAWHGSMVI